MRKTHFISVTVEEGKCGIPASNLPHFSPRTRTELLTESKHKREQDRLPRRYTEMLPLPTRRN